LVTPSPLIPLPLIKGKGEGSIREVKPLFDSSSYLFSLTWKVSKRGFAPLLIFFPLPYQGRGIKGVGSLLNNL